MKSGADYLAAGFGTATRRVHFVLLDMIAKALFWAVALMVLWLAFLWFIAAVPLTQAQSTAFQSGIPPLRAAAFIEAIAANLPILGRALLVAGGASLLVWTGLEAFVRAGLFPLTGDSILTDAVRHFPLYALSGVLRRTLLCLAAVGAGTLSLGPLLSVPVGQWSGRWGEVRWPIVGGVILVALLAFFLAVLDTLIRCEALALAEGSLPEILLVVGLPTLIETSMWSAAVALGAALTRSGVASGVTLILMAVIVVGLSAVHSYLLLARYSAVGIMQREWGRRAV